MASVIIFRIAASLVIFTSSMSGTMDHGEPSGVLGMVNISSPPRNAEATFLD